MASNNTLEAKLETAIASNNKLIETLEASVTVTGNSVNVNGEILEQLQKVADQIKVQLMEIKTEISGNHNTINDPIVSWILAIGFASIPFCFLIYMGMHRFKWFRKAKDAIRGNSSTDRPTNPSSNNGFSLFKD